jgi:predicted short-subunit dehydrogenase-like oxidoreductase (DUF2520 family)
VPYHTAAVFASNYVVVLARIASDLLTDAGVGDEDARRAVQRIIEGAAANVGARGAAKALTGPVVRGDVDTVRRHFASLPPEWRAVYRELVGAAMAMADLAPAQQEALRSAVEAVAHD